MNKKLIEECKGHLRDNTTSKQQYQTDIRKLITALKEAEKLKDLTENHISELANIGSKHLYLGAMDEGRLSHGGVLEIIKRYEEICNTER